MIQRVVQTLLLKLTKKAVVVVVEENGKEEKKQEKENNVKVNISERCEVLEECGMYCIERR
ncbi:hypothetical protein E2C01_101246 [Portunus trituberculatus]|uniref:Uncharacterized protein n=1 Tax=Portunus trituberculatus TaxID=210409 RepID=A0A5B7KJZ1_PORTR|nr:hypothetical protein [Portunus trituberculatus]